MADTRKPPDTVQSYFASARPRPVEARSQGSRLAHWPPPMRSAEIIRKVIKQPHKPEEPPNRAVRRGWRLKRELFSDEES
ncbi:MAG: hypothetical protein JWR89_3627 [Tardiphaga sp.]|jgi:hypothetical protein|uniref:hypothetical protein n=1 Tax=Tardiphaga sp. TaxID=1926292 RepID=UPI002632AB4E|nr:hypothetical protein [Tardiphaga sp.]MDB5503725.1 hypothetical protein [Tardiphaga sp.]